MAKRQEIRLCGFGGQGIILAGHIIGQAASIYENKHAVFIQDYGPEARGGACRADVVVSDERVLYPYIIAPSVLVALSQEAYDKYYHENRKDALVIIDEDLVKAGETKKNRLLTISAKRMAEELGRVTVANVVILGFLVAVTDIISIEALKKAVLASVPKGSEELNMKAIERGYTYGLGKLDSA
ncbi:2-oxoacid:acceptor oxidoreductase family protein [Chloroflexota bacterium]